MTRGRSFPSGFLPACLLAASLLLASPGVWGAGAGELSLDLAARYILEVVKAFRTTYVLDVLEHARGGGISPNENWQRDAHYVPLPAQFVKSAGKEIENFEIGLIGLSPLNKSNLPRTQAETDALIKLMGNSAQRIESFSDGDQYKAIAADRALVQSCVDCHNQHPQATRRNFQRMEVMGGVIVRLKGQRGSEGTVLPPAPPLRPPGPIERFDPPLKAPGRLGP